MEENKSKIIILCIVIGILLILTLFVLMVSNNEKKDINKEIIELKSNDFFRVQNIINNYYIGLMNDKNPSYVANNIYYNNDETIKYYFVNGYLIERDFEGEYDYTKNDNFLVIIKGNYYRIIKLDSNINIKDYAEKYEIINMDINDNIMRSYSISLENKLTYYISVFKDLVEIDPLLAYTYLGKDTLTKYTNYNDFYNERLNILNNLSTYINGYENENDNKYIVVDKNYKKTIITENSPMHFKIDF